MKAITYKVSKTHFKNSTRPPQNPEKRGVAYETETHFVHFYCNDDYWYVLSTGLTVIEKKDGSLTDWVKNTFGAEEIDKVSNVIGQAFDGIWRPGVSEYPAISEAIGSDSEAKHNDLISVRILLEKIGDIFSYVEPNKIGLQAHSHKSRELLILACTEVENHW